MTKRRGPSPASRQSYPARHDRHAEFSSLGFHVVAPKSQIDRGLFGELLSPASIREKVGERIAGYAGDRDAWFKDWFLPTLEATAIQCFCWEGVLDYIHAHDSARASNIREFYERPTQ